MANLTDLIGSPLSMYANVEPGLVTMPDGLEYLDLKPSFDAQHVQNVVQTQTADGQQFPSSAQLSSDPGGGASVGQVKDPTSVAAYFAQAVQRSPLLNASTTAELYDQSYHLLSQFKSPKYRFDELSIQPVDNANLWVQAIGREISDRVTVKRHPANLTTGASGNLIRKDAFVEQVSWSMMGLPEEWTVTFQLSPAGAPDDYPNDKTTPTWATVDDRVYGVFDVGNCFAYDDSATITGAQVVSGATLASARRWNALVDALNSGAGTSVPHAVVGREMTSSAWNAIVNATNTWRSKSLPTASAGSLLTAAAWNAVANAINGL